MESLLRFYIFSYLCRYGLDYSTVEGVDKDGNYMFHMSDNGNELIYNESSDSFKEQPYKKS